MACNCMSLSCGVGRGCMDNVGGLKSIYITDNCLMDWDLTINSDSVITDYTSNVTWYKFIPAKHSSNYTETINVSAEAGTLYYEGVVTALFNKMTAEKRNTFGELAKGETAVLFVDNNNNMWLVGEPENGCVFGGTSFQTGTALADSNGNNVTFTCQMAQPAFMVEPATGGKLETDLATADAACMS